MRDNLIRLKQLDQQLTSLKEKGYRMPKQGWVRTIRKALGMTIKQLARRLHVDPSRVVKIETSEIEGGITLRTMQSVAESIDCTFIYSFIPNSTLEEMVKVQARKVAMAEISRTAHTMDLEAQSVEKRWLSDQIEEEAQELLRKSWRKLWEE